MRGLKDLHGVVCKENQLVTNISELEGSPL